MDKRQQGFVIKLFWLLGYRRRQIHQEISATLGSDAYSEDSVQYWVARFQLRDTSCEDISRPGRPIPDLAETFPLFRQDCLFTIARMLLRHFNVCVITAKEILVHDLSLKKFTRRRVPHTLSDS
jgi:hypothetical protein